jgi:hypothetical protein
MSDATTLRDREIAARFREGPTRAPAGLLEATMAASRRAAQRPGLVAGVLGAPGAGRPISAGRRSWSGNELRMLLVALALLLAAATVYVLSGSPRDRLPTAITSTTPTSRTPQPTPAVSTQAPTASLPDNPDALRDPSWSFSIERPAEMPWQAVEPGFDGNLLGIDAVGDPTRYVAVSGEDHAAWDVYFGRCASNACAGPLVTVSVAREPAGPLVGTTSCNAAPPSFVIDCIASNDAWPVTISGTTLEELKDAWVAKFGSTAPATQSSLDGEPAIVFANGGRQTLVALHGDVVVAILLQPRGGTDVEAAAALAAVIANFHFDEPQPTFVLPPSDPTRLGKLRLTMPEGWIIHPGATELTVRSTGGGIFAIEQDVIVTDPGSGLTIHRPVMVNNAVVETAGFSIDGDTYNQLVASIDAGMPDATRSAIRIDGVKAFRWSVPQTSMIHPLVAVAAVEWKGRFYVFVEHLPLDGLPGSTFDVLLNGVELL